MKNWRKKKSSSKISSEGELRKKNNSSGAGGGLEKDSCQNKNYNKTIPEEGELEKGDGEQNTVVVLKLGLNSQRYATDIKEWLQSCGG